MAKIVMGAVVAWCMVGGGAAVSMGVELTTQTRVATTSQAMDLEFPEPHREWLQGPFGVVINVTKFNGKPANGKPYKVTWSSTGFQTVTVAEGIVAEGGLIRLEGLAGVEKESTPEDFEKRGGVPTFDVEVDGENVGYVAFTDARDGKLYPPKEGKTKEYSFKIPPKAGDTAPDIEVMDLGSSKTLRLSDLRGQVVLLDFWASWCGPCQRPMAEYQDVLRRHEEDWKGKATILTVSIDDDQETVRRHLKKNGWDRTLNAWAMPSAEHPDKIGWYSPAAELYGITSTPTVLLIDKDGVITKRGHIDTEREMKALVQ